MADFGKLLSKPVADIKKPVLLPKGTYFGTITQKVLGESKQKQTPFCEFKATLSRAGDDVDPALLGEIDVSRKSFSGQSNSGLTFYLSENAEFMLLSFCKTFGKNTEGLSMGELIEIPIGEEIMIFVDQEPNQAGTEFYNKLVRAVGTKGEA